MYLYGIMLERSQSSTSMAVPLVLALTTLLPLSQWYDPSSSPEMSPPSPIPYPIRFPSLRQCPDFEDFVKLFLAGKAECGSWFNHTLEWYAASLTDPNILFLKYEDMIKDPKVCPPLLLSHTPHTICIARMYIQACISQIAAFIGVGNDEVTIDKVVENSSMSNMKKTSGVYAGNVRKGGIGNWRNKLLENSCANAMFDGEYMKQMKQSNLEFDFGDGLVM